MSELDAAYIRAPEPIIITVGTAKHLRGSKGDSSKFMIKLEFGEKVLGESQNMECGSDGSIEFKFKAELNCVFDDPFALDEIAHKPVILTVIEVLPKERRQKEEKTNILGQCSIDLFTILKGDVTYHAILIINATQGSVLENILPEHPKPEVDITLSVESALLNDQQLKGGNFLCVTVESLFSPPDAWQLTGSQFCFSAALPVTYNGDKEIPIVFPCGQLRQGIEKEPPNKQKKWPVSGTAVGNSIYIPDCFISTDPVEDEDGDFKEKEFRDHRYYSEIEKLRVTWNTERRCYMDSGAVKGFQDSIAKNRCWPIEIFRLSQPAGGKIKKEDDSSIGFHGVAFLNLSPLLYPGVKRVRGAYKVLPYSDNILMEKTNRKVGIAEEAARLALSQLTRTCASPSPKKGLREKEGEKKDVKKGAHVPGKSTALKSDTGSDVDGQAVVNVEGQHYADAKSYIMVEISLTRPLVPKRPTEELARRVAELIPPRPAFPVCLDSADKAVKDYHSQIADVAVLVLDEFRDMFGEEIKNEMSNTNEMMEERRQNLLYQLNSSGKYFAFKEQLKHSVVKIVREKFLKTTNFESQQQLQNFLSDLYVYLIDQMHQSLNNVLQIEDQLPIPPPLTTNAQLKHFAQEAEMERQFDLAKQYYQEAEECFHQCISINQEHLEGLMLYGIVCALQEKDQIAETFFEVATNVDPRNVLTWTLLGLFYDAISHDIGAEMAFAEANRLNVQQTVSCTNRPVDHECAHDNDKMGDPERRDCIGIRAVGGESEPVFRSTEGGFSIHPHDIKQPSTVDAPSSVSSRSSKADWKSNRLTKRESIFTKRTSIRQRSRSIAPLAVARKSISQPLRPCSQLKTMMPETSAVAVVGGLDTSASEALPLPPVSIFMQAVEWLLKVKVVTYAELALAHQLLVSPSEKTVSFHVATARLKLLKQEYVEAESSLNEALQCDHQNPDCWALLGHVKYLTGDTDEAMKLYERTLSYITDASETHCIYLRLASIYLRIGKYQQAKQTYLTTCKESPSCSSWLGVGIACYKLDELSDAEEALMEANILNNMNADVWGYLSLVCLRTSRQVEAEQSYKFAVKLNLQDEGLLQEIRSEQDRVGFGNPQF